MTSERSGPPGAVEVAHFDPRTDGQRAEYAAVRARLLDPLELRRTSVGFDGGPQVTGYYVAPYDDVPRPEPVIDLRAMAREKLG